ncbi:NUDIX domain-containing protein [Paenibacillus sp. PL2-23]|uniref:NUDIX hydrolase n=1 Tax=Paenibacillus sp. PL2-23 TaxID=2100729 RepID=UPI0030F54F03
MPDDELFDIYDKELRHIGTATRADTHARGYWHRSFHCWLARRDGDRRYVRFQLRQLTKDTNPGCFDITAAGHLTAGETVRDAVRELEEEIGVTASFEELIPLGQITEEEEGMVNGRPFIDREVSDVFALISDVPLTALRLQPEEVAGVFEVEVEELLALFEGRRGELAAHGVELTGSTRAEAEATNEPIGLRPSTRSVRANQFVPRDNRYYVEVMNKLLALSY